MPFVNIELLLKSFPELKKERDDLQNQGYALTNYGIETSLEKEFSNDMLEIIMTNQQENKILIRQYKFNFLNEMFSEVYKIDITPTTSSIHPDIKLDPEKIIMKDFKKKFIGGYDLNEVKGFLDIVAEDYQKFKELLENNLDRNKWIIVI